MTVKNKTAAKKAPKKAQKASPKKPATTAARPAVRVIETTNLMEKTMTQGKSQFDKLTQDAGKAGKEQMDACMKAGNVFIKGFEDIAKTYMGWAQESAEKNSQALKTLMSCKTINEYAETHNKWAQQNFDDFMSGATKLTELSVKLASDTFEPINDQFSKSIKKATEAVAA